MTMSSSGAAPAIGAEVFTADGDKLGKVKEVSGSCFKVDASMRPDYWLASDTITGTTGGGVRLAFAKDQLGDMKMDRPDDMKGHEHMGIHRHSDSDTVL